MAVFLLILILALIILGFAVWVNFFKDSDAARNETESYIKNDPQSYIEKVKEWYVKKGEKVTGPFTGLELTTMLLTKEVGPQTRIRREGDASFKSLADYHLI